MKHIIHALLSVVAILFVGCFKDNSYESTYVLKPLIQNMSVDQPVPLAGVKAYVYPVDTTLWGIASYEDAEAGIITLKEDPSQQMTAPSSVAVPYTGTTDAETSEEGAAVGVENWLQMTINAPQQMIVAVDPTHRLYGYTQQEHILNLPTVFVSVVFQLWKENRSYKNGNWSFYNDFLEIPTELKTYISPKIQTVEDGELTDPTSATQMQVYAYAADTTQWYIASYEDARNGKITYKSDVTQTRIAPTYQAYRESSGLYGMTVTTTPLMVVVVDRSNRLYAYSKQEPDLLGASPTYPVVFRLWRDTWISVEEGWRIVNENFRPENTVTFNTSR